MAAVIPMRKKSQSQLLPTDIQYEILIRLPVKTLTRFRCCCKSWYSLVSSSPFQQDHLHRWSKKPLLLTIVKDAEDHSTLQFRTYINKIGGTLVSNFSKTVPSLYQSRPVKVVQSCLGLVCLASKGDNKNAFICNPSTEELISLPPIHVLACCIGFGRAASTQEFKVVIFLQADVTIRSSSTCKIFTLGTSAGWKKSTNAPYPVEFGTAPFLHGALHMLPDITYGVRENDYVASFDLDCEKYGKIPLPVYYASMFPRLRPNRHLTELAGSLCLTFNFSESEGRLEIWLLKDYKNAEWMKGHNIDLSSLIDRPIYDNTWFTFARPVGLMGDQSMLLNVFQLKGTQLLCYNSQEKTLTRNSDDSGEATFYVESFFPLGSR